MAGDITELGAALRLLEAVTKQYQSMSVDIRDIRERLIRVEAQDYHSRLHELETQNHALRERLTVMETHGKFFTAGLAAAVSILISVAGAVGGYFLK